MNFGQNRGHYQAHFDFHRKQSIFLYKMDGIDNSSNENFEDTEDVEKESTFLVLQ